MEETKKKFPWVIVVAIIAVLAAAIFGLYTLNQKKIKETETLTKIVKAEDIAGLEKYESLKTLDLSGSDCYEEIMAYAAAHPEVDVSYTVDVDGVVIGSKDKELNYEGHDTAALLEHAKYLPALTKVELGETALSAAELTELSAALNGAELEYSFKAFGKSFDKNETGLDLSALKASELDEAIDTLAKLPELKSVKVNPELAFADYAKLFAANPDADYDYSFQLFGEAVDTHTAELRYKKVHIGDEGIKQMYDYLPCMPNLTYLSFDRCDTTDEVVAQLREDFPDVKIAWRIFFGPFSVMTDVEKIWAIGALNDENIQPIKYCTDIKYLDVGHNEISKIDFIKNMPNLEVGIFSITYVDDLSPVVNCQKLEYLEFCSSYVTDLTPVAQVPNIQHIHMGANDVLSDITPIYDMPNLKRVYMSDSWRIPQSQVDRLRELHPDCDINNDYSLMPLWTGTWRYTQGMTGDYSERYALLRQQIGYDDPEGDSRLYEYREN